MLAEFEFELESELGVEMLCLLDGKLVGRLLARLTSFNSLEGIRCCWPVVSPLQATVGRLERLTPVPCPSSFPIRKRSEWF